MKRILILAIAILYISLPGTIHPAGRLVEEGVLSSVEERGVIIDGKGYLLSSHVKVLDERGRRISIERLNPPVKVHFEYTYERKGPVIILIRRIPEVLPK